jgi:hypothetical protein
MNQFIRYEDPSWSLRPSNQFTLGFTNRFIRYEDPSWSLRPSNQFTLGFTNQFIRYVRILMGLELQTVNRFALRLTRGSPLHQLINGSVTVTVTVTEYFCVCVGLAGKIATHISRSLAFGSYIENSETPWFEREIRVWCLSYPAYSKAMQFTMESLWN